MTARKRTVNRSATDRLAQVIKAELEKQQTDCRGGGPNSPPAGEGVPVAIGPRPPTHHRPR